MLPHAQLYHLAVRGLVSYWRNPAYNLLRMVVTIGLGLALGTLYWDRGTKRSSLLGVLDIMGALYTSSLFLAMVNCLTVRARVLTRCFAHEVVAIGSWGKRAQCTSHRASWPWSAAGEGRQPQLTCIFSWGDRMGKSGGAAVPPPCSLHWRAYAPNTRCLGGLTLEPKSCQPALALPRPLTSLPYPILTLALPPSLPFMRR